MIFSGVTVLQGVKFPIFLLIFTWAFRQQCSATALPVIGLCKALTAKCSECCDCGSPSVSAVSGYN